MTLLANYEALCRHIPSFSLFLDDALPRRWEEKEVAWDEKAAFVISFGVDLAVYEKARKWLDQDSSRRLVFIEEEIGPLKFLEKEAKASSLLSDARVKIYFSESPLQLEPIAKEVGRQAAFLPLACLNFSGSPNFSFFKKIAEESHLTATLLLSDAADYGVGAVKNGRKNLKAPFCPLHCLAGAFKKIPAVIIGGGPSLKKNGHLLKQFERSALLFSGGAALDYLDILPHIAGAVDKEGEVTRKRFSSDVPICFLARAHPKQLANFCGPRILAPDPHFAFLNAITDSFSLESGWTVGTFLTAVACFLGCDPIIFVGMDYAYENGMKYPEKKGDSSSLIAVKSQKGETVFTQPDWVQAAYWTENFAKSHPEIQWINATEGGLGFSFPIQEKRLDEMALPIDLDLRKKVKETLAFPTIALKWEEWKKALLEAAKNRENLEESSIYETLLKPLWALWRPIFEREVDIDPRPFTREEKLRAHKEVFFAQVIREHLHALS